MNDERPPALSLGWVLADCSIHLEPKGMPAEKNVERAAILLKPIHARVEGIDRPRSTTRSFVMSNSSESALPSDIRLLLRADAEQCWLHREVIPVLREVETPGELAEEEVGAALAYLEAMWSEATSRARETDAAHLHLISPERTGEALAGPAGHYHAAVRVLREIVAERITPFVEPNLDFETRPQTGGGSVRITDKRPGGCQAA